MLVWEPKFVRERYIRVAAIDIVVKAGIKNIYVIRTHKNQYPLSLLADKLRTMLNASNMSGRGIKILHCYMASGRNQIPLTFKQTNT